MIGFDVLSRRIGVLALVVGAAAAAWYGAEGLTLAHYDARAHLVVARRILDALTSRRVYLSKIIVVDEETDVFNMTEVTHALATRCHPARGIQHTVYEGRAQTLTPYYNRAERATRTGATAVFDATWPPDLAPEDTPVPATFHGAYPADLRERVLADWRTYGF